MKKRIAIFLAAILILAFSLSACNAVNEIKAVGDTGKAFMKALETSDDAASWALLAPNVQQEIGDQNVWVEWTSVRHFPKWSFNNTEVTNDTARMDGTAELDGYQYTVTLIFDKINDTWLISGINFE